MKMTKKEQTLILVLICLILGLVAYLAIMSPMMNANNEKSAQLMELQEDIDTKQALIDQIPTFQDNINMSVAKFDKLRNQFYDYQGTPELHTELYTVQTKCALTFESISLTNPVLASDYNGAQVLTSTVTMQELGGTNEVVKLVDSINEKNTNIDFSSLTATIDDENPAIYHITAIMNFNSIQRIEDENYIYAVPEEPTAEGSTEAAE